MFPFAEQSGPFMQSSVVKNTVTSEPLFLPFNSTLCDPEDEFFVTPSTHIGSQYESLASATNAV